MDVVNAAVADGNSKITKANEQIIAANDKLKNVQSVADQLTALSANAAEGETVQVPAEILKSLANTLQCTGRCKCRGFCKRRYLHCKSSNSHKRN